MARFLWICLGGAFGTGARYLLGGLVARAWGTTFPVGTLAVNALGSFLLGAVMQVGIATDLLPPALRLALATGVLGGFTTYSTFNYETLQFVVRGDSALALANVFATVFLCLAAGAAGAKAAGWLVAR